MLFKPTSPAACGRRAPGSLRDYTLSVRPARVQVDLKHLHYSGTGPGKPAVPDYENYARLPNSSIILIAFAAHRRQREEDRRLAEIWAALSSLKKKKKLQRAAGRIVCIQVAYSTISCVLRPIADFMLNLCALRAILLAQCCNLIWISFRRPFDPVFVHKLVGPFGDFSRLPRFKQLLPIGQGSFGTVFTSMDQKIGKLVAVKDVYVDDGAMNQAKAEALLMSSVHHHNVVTLTSPCIVDIIHRRFIIPMELANAGSLDELLELKSAKGEKALHESEIAYVCKQVLQGLQAMHKLGITHRDIKPANLLVWLDGNIKIADFGLAGQTTAAEPYFCAAEGMPGTPLYMAPELCRGQEYGTAVDIWALGVLAMGMAEGGAPLRLETTAERVIEIIARYDETNSPRLEQQSQCRYRCFTGPWSLYFRHFVRQALTVDAGKRVSATELLKHPFLRLAESEAKMGKLIADTFSPSPKKTEENEASAGTEGMLSQYIREVCGGDSTDESTAAASAGSALGSLLVKQALLG